MAERQRQADGANKAYYQQVTGAIREINRNVRLKDIPRFEQVAITNVLRKPTTASIRSYVDRAYPFTALDGLEAELQEQNRNLTGTESPEQVVMGFYMNALSNARSIDLMKTASLGRKASTAASNMISSIAIDRMAWFVGTKYATELGRNTGFLGRLMEFSEELFNEPDENVQWYAAKSFMFVEGVMQAVGFNNHLDEKAREAGDMQELQSANNALFQRTGELRSYGIKSAVAPGLQSGFSINEWLVLDPITEVEGMREVSTSDTYKFMPPHIVRFAGTTGRFRSSRLEYTEKTGDKGQTGRMTMSTFPDVLEEGSHISAFVSLTEEGDLKTMYGLPIKDMFTHNRIDLFGYESLRSELLCIYADLVTPAFVAQALHEEEKPQRLLGVIRRKRKKRALRDLVLARVKIIDEQHEPILEALEQGEDVVEAIFEHQQREAIPRSKHDVIGHRRKLASHQRATPQARELAWNEARIELAVQGETYVKKHSRGSETDDSLGHRATVRRRSAAREPGDE